MIEIAIRVDADRIVIDQVRRYVGHTDASAFANVFDRVVGLPPSDYRPRFSNGDRIPG